MLRTDGKQKQALTLRYDNRFCFCLFSMVNLTKNSALGLSISNGVFGSLALPTCLGYQRVGNSSGNLCLLVATTSFTLQYNGHWIRCFAGSMTAQGDARSSHPTPLLMSPHTGHLQIAN